MFSLDWVIWIHYSLSLNCYYFLLDFVFPYSVPPFNFRKTLYYNFNIENLFAYLFSISSLKRCNKFYFLLIKRLIECIMMSHVISVNKKLLLRSIICVNKKKHSHTWTMFNKCCNKIIVIGDFVIALIQIHMGWQFAQLHNMHKFSNKLKCL